MQAKSASLAVGAGVELNMPSRFGFGLAFFTKEFSEDFPKMSYLEYARHYDILVKARVAAVITRYVQWNLHAALGVSMVTIQYMDVDPVNPKMGDYKGYYGPIGPVKRKSITALTSGLGTRFAVYPVDFIGIFVESTVLFAFQQALEMDQGPLTLQAVGGVEAHF